MSRAIAVVVALFARLELPKTP